MTVGQEESVTLPEVVDPNDDEVTIKVELDEYSQFISYNEDDKVIEVKPDSDQYLGLARVKVILDDQRDTREYYILFSIIADTTQEDESEPDEFSFDLDPEDTEDEPPEEADEEDEEEEEQDEEEELDGFGGAFEVVEDTDEPEDDEEEQPEIEEDEAEDEEGEDSQQEEEDEEEEVPAIDVEPESFDDDENE